MLSISAMMVSPKSSNLPSMMTKMKISKLKLLKPYRDRLLAVLKLSMITEKPLATCKTSSYACIKESNKEIIFNKIEFNNN